MPDNNAVADIRQRVIHQFLDILILDKLLVAEHPKSKRFLQNYIFDVSGVLVDDGFVFPLLGLLEKKGFIKGHSREVHGRIKRFYKITDEGVYIVKQYQECYEETVMFIKTLFKKA